MEPRRLSHPLRSPVDGWPPSSPDVPPDATPSLPEWAGAKAALSVAEAAGLLGLSTNTVYALARAGELPAVKAAGRVLIPVGPFRDWLAGKAA